MPTTQLRDRQIAPSPNPADNETFQVRRLGDAQQNRMVTTREAFFNKECPYLRVVRCFRNQSSKQHLIEMARTATGNKDAFRREQPEGQHVQILLVSSPAP